MGLLLRVAELVGQPGGQQLAEQGYLDRMWAADQETAREPGEARLLGVRRPALGSCRVGPSATRIPSLLRFHTNRVWSVVFGRLAKAKPPLSLACQQRPPF